LNALLIHDWLTWLGAGNAAHSTLRLRGYALHAFARRVDLRTADGPDVADYLASLPGGAWSHSSHLAALRGFYRWAVLTGVVDHDPTKLVHGIKVPDGVPRPVPEHVVQAALASCDGQTRLMILLGAYAGLRRAEIAALHSVDVSDTTLTVCGKGGRTRLIPVHPRLRPYLGFTGYAFPSHRIPGAHVHPDTVGTHVAAALGGGYTCHQLRHRFATVVYAACHDVLVVQRLLGHADVATTMIYVGIGMESERAAVLSVA
jgi:site-specific recombinase XerD